MADKRGLLHTVAAKPRTQHSVTMDEQEFVPTAGASRFELVYAKLVCLTTNTFL